MKALSNTKKLIILGIFLIIIAILIGIIFMHDIAFIFGGVGVVSIGIAILLYINKKKGD